MTEGALDSWFEATRYMNRLDVGRIILMAGYRATPRSPYLGRCAINPAATALLPAFRGWNR